MKVLLCCATSVLLLACGEKADSPSKSDGGDIGTSETAGEDQDLGIPDSDVDDVRLPDGSGEDLRLPDVDRGPDGSDASVGVDILDGSDAFDATDGTDIPDGPDVFDAIDGTDSLAEVDVEACIPNCLADDFEKECGDDGCGELCGICDAEEYCSAGTCAADECLGLPDLTGTIYRSTSFQLSEPTDAMNEVWAVSKRVILLEIVTHDQAQKTLVIKLGLGVASEELVAGVPTVTEYNFAPEPGQVQAALQGCELIFAEALDLPLIFGKMNKPFPVTVYNGKCILASDGSSLSSGELHGVVPDEGLQDLCVEIPGMGVANLHWFFNLAHICPGVDSDDDGLVDSHEFAAQFKGDSTALFQPAIVGVEPEVEQCVSHDEVCVD